jgi:hypothetical protein
VPETSLEISFEFRTKRFQDAAKGLIAFGQSFSAAWDQVPPVLKSELRDYLAGVARALASRHGNPWPSGTTNTSLSRRSGQLIAAIPKSVAVYGQSFADIYGTIGTGDLIYGRLQEAGGWVRPKKSKYLTIPLPAALNADGTPKKTSAREWENTFVLRSKAGNLLIVQKTEVYVPPRLMLSTTLQAGLPYFVEHAMEAMLRKVQQGLG